MIQPSFFTLSADFRSVAIIDEHLNFFEDHDDIFQLFSNTDTQQFLDWDKSLQIKSVERDHELTTDLLTIVFRSSIRQTKSFRRVYSIMEFLADLGGLYGSLVLLGVFYSFFYSRHL